MNRAKRLLAFLCAAALLSLSACAGNAGSGSPSAGDETGSSAESGAKDNDNKDNKKKSKGKKDKKKSKEDVIFSEPSGFYDEPFELELASSKPGYKVYYTTDGSVPDENSTPYTEPIMLSDRSEEPNSLSAHTDIHIGETSAPKDKVKKANVIRAAAYNSNGRLGEVVSHTYFIGLDRAKLYGNVPVISLITPEDGLFGYETGIYVLGKSYDDFIAADPKNAMIEPWHQLTNFSQRGREWERETSVEYLTADGSEGLSQLMGLRIMGAASRYECQKSFRLRARGEYGKKNVKYGLIPNNTRSDGKGDVEKYDSFVLRNGGNDCNGTKLRDPLIQDLVSERAFDTLRSCPAVVFLNGEYWGMYSLTEDYSDNYIENNYGIDKNNVIIIKRGDLEEGDLGDDVLFTEMFDFIMNNDMSDSANYEKASEMLDMQGFADLCALNVYTNNEDGIFQNNNYRFWRVRTPDGSCPQADGKWRVLLYDTEYSTGVYDGGQSAGFDTLKLAIDGAGKPTRELKEPPSDLFRKLLENESFKDMFIMSMCDMRNLCFNKEHAKARLDEMAEVYRPLVNDSFRRYSIEWGDFDGAAWGLTNFIDSRYNGFMKMITDNFGDMKKAEVVIMKTEGGRILVNGTTADPNMDIKAAYFTKYPLGFTAVPDEGKRFVEWRYIGNSTIPDDKSDNITVNLDGDLSITAVFE